MKKSIPLILVTLLFFAPASAQFNRDAPIDVVVSEAVKVDFFDVIESLGTAKSNESVEITSNVTEKIHEIKFQEGQQVAEGETLVILKSDEEQAQLASARATLKAENLELERVQKLVKNKTVSQSRLDNQQAAYDNAVSMVNQAQARLDDRIIKAPFKGILGIRNISPGSLIESGDVITTLDDISTIRLDFTIPETFLSEVKVGQKIEAYTDAFKGKSFAGEIGIIDTRVDPVTRAITLRAFIDNPNFILKPGMLMQVRLQSKPREALVIPEESLISLEDKKYVYKISGDETSVEYKMVRIGSRKPGVVEIIEGLEYGDLVVTEGQIKLRPTSKIKIIGNDENAASEHFKAKEN
jgi:membrane fusion protein (multidrug efflux system)